MLPPFIIDQIRRREEERRRHQQAPQLELPLPSEHPARNSEPEEEAERGVIVVDLG